MEARREISGLRSRPEAEISVGGDASPVKVVKFGALNITGAILPHVEGTLSEKKLETKLRRARGSEICQDGENKDRNDGEGLRKCKGKMGRTTTSSNLASRSCMSPSPSMV